MAKLEHKVGEVIEIIGQKYIVEECSDTNKGCKPCDLSGMCSIKPYLSLAGLCIGRTDRKSVIFKQVK